MAIVLMQLTRRRGAYLQWWCALTLLSLFAAVSQAQLVPGAPGQDPLMALMLSQPRIDVDSPVVPVAGFDPPVVQPGREAVYRVTFNALEASIKFPSKLTGSPAAELRPAAHGQLLVMTGTNYQPRTSFNFRVRLSQAGQFVVPQYTVRVYGKDVVVPAAQLSVSSQPPPGIPPAQTLSFDLPRTNIYVGQGLRASVTLPPASSLVLQHSSPMQITGEGLVVDPNTLRPRMETRRLGGSANEMPSIAYEIVVTPIAVGKITAFAQAFVGSRLSQTLVPGPSGTLQAFPQYTLVDSEPIDINVLPLPKEGQLPGFTGGVGAFMTETPELTTNFLQVGVPVKLTVRVRGQGNLLRLVPPPPPKIEDWRVFAGEPNPTHPQIIQAQGFTIFNYTLVPLSDQARHTPRIPFSCFDPSEGRYVDASVPSVQVTILPGTLPADLKVLERADAVGGVAEKEPVLSGLASSPGLSAASLVPLQRQFWFPVLQLVPAAAFAALWNWDRRRRYFAAHPEVLLKRRARRALRRQWRVVRKAAARNDHAQFACGVVRALDIASSPFYPADPLAIVGADVLALLPEAERGGARGQAVRGIFQVHDALHYSSEPPELGQVLQLRPELEALIQSLEAKLRS